MRLRMLGLGLIIALGGLAGCRSCPNCFDYTGPVLNEGAPTYGFYDRRNSILSPDPEGRYAATQQVEPAPVDEPAMGPQLEPIPDEPPRPDPNRSTRRIRTAPEPMVQ